MDLYSTLSAGISVRIPATDKPFKKRVPPTWSPLGCHLQPRNSLSLHKETKVMVSEGHTHLSVTEDDFYEVRLHTLSVLVEDTPDTLIRVIEVISRRGYNIESMMMRRGETDGLSHIEVVVPGTETSIQRLIQHLQKLVYLHEVKDLSTQ